MLELLLGSYNGRGIRVLRPKAGEAPRECLVCNRQIKTDLFVGIEKAPHPDRVSALCIPCAVFRGILRDPFVQTATRRTYDYVPLTEKEKMKMGLNALKARYSKKNATPAAPAADVAPATVAETTAPVPPDDIVETSDDGDDDSGELEMGGGSFESTPTPGELKKQLDEIDVPKHGIVSKADIKDIVEMAVTAGNALIIEALNKQLTPVIKSEVASAMAGLKKDVTDTMLTLAGKVATVDATMDKSVEALVKMITGIADVDEKLNGIIDALTDGDDEEDELPPVAAKPAADAVGKPVSKPAAPEAPAPTAAPHEAGPTVSITTTQNKLAKIEESSERMKVALQDQVPDNGIGIDKLGEALAAVGMFTKIPNDPTNFHKSLSRLIMSHGYDTSKNGLVTRTK